MTKAGKKIQLQVTVCRRSDGLYTVSVIKPGEGSQKVTGCTWEEAEALISQAAPKARAITALPGFAHLPRLDALGGLLGAAPALGEHSAACAGDEPAKNCGCRVAETVTGASAH